MLGRLGRKHMEIATSFASSAVGFGGAALCTLVYFTDWKVFTSYIPFYSGKYVEEEKSE